MCRGKQNSVKGVTNVEKEKERETGVNSTRIEIQGVPRNMTVGE